MPLVRTVTLPAGLISISNSSCAIDTAPHITVGRALPAVIALFGLSWELASPPDEVAALRRSGVADANLDGSIRGNFLIHDTHVAFFEFGDEAVVDILLGDPANQVFADLAQLRLGITIALHANSQGASRVTAKDSPDAVL